VQPVATVECDVLGHSMPWSRSADRSGRRHALGQAAEAWRWCGGCRRPRVAREHDVAMARSTRVTIDEALRAP